MGRVKWCEGEGVAGRHGGSLRFTASANMAKEVHALPPWGETYGPPPVKLPSIVSFDSVWLSESSARLLFANVNHGHLIAAEDDIPSLAPSLLPMDIHITMPTVQY